ncbi:MAG TPA: hypothetical protein VIW73_10310 [Candidatus Cybelea sp.]
MGPLLMTFDPGAGEVYTSYTRSRLNGRIPDEVCLSTACVHSAMGYVGGDPNQLDPQHDTRTGTIAGSVGPAFLRRYAVRINYHDSTLALLPITAFRPASDAVRLPIAFDSYGLPVVHATIDGISAPFELDVRAPTSMLFRPFLERTALSQFYAAAPIVRRSSTLVAHAVRKVDVAGFQLRDVPFWFSTATDGKFANPAVAGLLGNNVLSHFVLTLDFSHRAAYVARR